MSSILDSLKKSDKARSQKMRDSGPGFTFAGASRTGRRRWGLYLLLLALLVAAVLWYWKGDALRYMWSDLTGAATPANDPVAAQTVAPERPKERSEAAEDKPHKPAGAATAAVPAPDARQVKKRLLTQINQPIQHKPDGLDTAVEDAAAATESQAQAVAEAGRDVKTPQQAATLAEPGPEPTRDPGQTKQQEHLYVHQLPFSIRRHLPRIKLSVHVYDPDPKNRLAIINGLSLAIDDVIEDTVRVSDITEEGVILEFEGTTFMLPR